MCPMCFAGPLLLLLNLLGRGPAILCSRTLTTCWDYDWLRDRRCGHRPHRRRLRRSCIPRLLRCFLLCGLCLHHFPLFTIAQGPALGWRAIFVSPWHNHTLQRGLTSRVFRKDIIALSLSSFIAMVAELDFARCKSLIVTVTGLHCRRTQRCMSLANLKTKITVAKAKASAICS